MVETSDISRVRETHIACDGGADVAPALGHPKVWLQIDESGAVTCGYCDRQFILIGGAADHGKNHRSI